MIWNRWRGFDKTWTNPAESRAWKERCPSLAEVAYWQVDRANLTGDGEAVRVGAGLRVGERLRGARRAPDARPRPFTDGGGPLRGAEGRDPRARALAGPVRRRPGRSWGGRWPSTGCPTRSWASCRPGSRCPPTSARTRPSPRSSTCPARPSPTSSPSSATTATTRRRASAPARPRPAPPPSCGRRWSSSPPRAATTRDRTTTPSRCRWRTRSWERTGRSWRWSRRRRSSSC